MAARFNLKEHTKIIPAFVPIDTTGAAQAGDYINMALAETMWCIILQGAWAGGTPAVTMTQGTTASGGTTAAFTDFAAWNGTALTDDALTAVTVTAGTFNLAATANQFTVVRAHADAMTDGKKFLKIGVASPGSNADLIACVYILTGLKYLGKTPPSMIA